jgi:hypothetical protein
MGGVKVTLEKLVTTYVSYLEENEEITSEQKHIALLNSGFYYKTLKSAQDANIESGIIFVLENNTFYTANKGKLTKFQFSETKIINDKPQPNESITKPEVEENKVSAFNLSSTQDNFIIKAEVLNEPEVPTTPGAETPEIPAYYKIKCNL